MDLGDLEPRRRDLRCRVGRPRSVAEIVQRPGRSWRAARFLFRAVLAHLLAGGAARRAERACRVGGAMGATDKLSARLARPVLDRLRARGDEVAALRAAALSR